MILPFNQVLKDCTRFGKKIPTKDYLEKGEYPIIDQGQKDIAGYRNDKDGLFCDVPAIIFGDHTRAVKYIETPCFLGADGVKLLCPVDRTMNCKYLYYQLHHARIPNTGYNRHFKFVKALTFTIPEIHEQNEVVDRLVLLDRVIRICHQLLEKADALVKSRFVEMFGDPTDNPMSWEKLPLGNRCKIITGNTPPRADADNYGSFLEWIKSDNINTPETYLTKAQEYLSEKGFNLCRYVESGSILMTCIAGSRSCIGNVGVANRRVAFNQQINAIVPDEDETLYIYWLMQLSKPYIQSTINMALKGILSKSHLSTLEFPFPPFMLQQDFAAFVADIEKSKSAVTKCLQKAEYLKSALMQQYFG